LRKIVIGLTGPTGAGKSTVAAELEQEGCHVIDADLIARQIVTHPDCIAELKAEYGSDIMDQGSINRRLLAQRAFSSPQNAARLNEITHPKIMKEVIRQIALSQQSGTKAIVLDAALLFESGADQLCTTTIAVTAPLEVRLNRIMKRDSIPMDLAKARIEVQHGNVYYNERAQYVLNGAICIDAIPAAVERLLKRIIGDMNESI